MYVAAGRWWIARLTARGVSAVLTLLEFMLRCCWGELVAGRALETTASSWRSCKVDALSGRISATVAGLCVATRCACGLPPLLQQRQLSTGGCVQRRHLVTVTIMGEQLGDIVEDYLIGVQARTVQPK
jgi:hypothetical protein